jgi:hypothetical protein
MRHQGATMLRAITRLSVAPAMILLMLIGCSKPETSIAASAPASVSSSPEAKTAKGLELVKLTGAGDAVMQYVGSMLPQMIDIQKKSHPEITDQFWDEFTKSFQAQLQSRSGEILEKLAPVYAAHYSDAEMDQIIAFYKSDAGQKAVHDGAAMMQDSLKIGQDWSDQIAQAAATQATANLRPQSPQK